MFNVIDPHTAFLITTHHQVFVYQDKWESKMELGRGDGWEAGGVEWASSPGQVLSEKYAKLVVDHCNRARMTTGNTDWLPRPAHVWLQLHR